MNSYFWQTNNFLRFRIKTIFISILVLISVITGSVFYRILHLSSTLAYQQIKDSNQSVLRYFSSNLSGEVSHADQEFYYILNNNLDVSILETASSEDDNFLSVLNLSQMLKRIYTNSELMEMVFLYSPAGAEEEYLLYSDQLFSVDESTVLKEKSISVCQNFLSGDKIPASNWFVQDINGTPYLIRIIRSGQTFCGGFIRLPLLLNDLNMSFDSMGSLSVFSADGQWLCGDSSFSSVESASSESDLPITYIQGKAYIISSVIPEMMDFTIMTFFPVEQLSGSAFQNYMGFIIFCCILIFLIFILYISFILLYRPNLYLSNAMNMIIKGDLTFRIHKKTRIYETARIYRTFNHMLDEIANLKSELYKKEQIAKQFFQIQLKSHFFLNCLNIIYSMAQTRHYDLIQKLTMCLVKYFRYLSLNSEELVPLGKELEHLNNYMEIQQLRFPGKITFLCHIDEALFDFPIPLLMLHTFLENAVRHGRNPDSVTSIHLYAQPATRRGKKGLQFIISDNGKGFRADILALYQNQDFDLPASGKQHGIGILNIRSRLHCIYHGNEFLEITNGPSGGALITIWIPSDNSIK